MSEQEEKNSRIDKYDFSKWEWGRESLEGERGESSGKIVERVGEERKCKQTTA